MQLLERDPARPARARSAPRGIADVARRQAVKRRSCSRCFGVARVCIRIRAGAGLRAHVGQLGVPRPLTSLTIAGAGGDRRGAPRPACRCRPTRARRARRRRARSAARPARSPRTASTGGRLVTPDSPPMSISAAPAASGATRPARRAPRRDRSRPASENESGVALTIPDQRPRAGPAERHVPSLVRGERQLARSAPTSPPAAPRRRTRLLRDRAASQPSPRRSPRPTRCGTSPAGRAAPGRRAGPRRVRRSSTSPTLRRLLVARRERRLGQQVGQARRRSAAPAGPRSAAVSSTCARGVAVAAGQRRVRLVGHALDRVAGAGVDRHAQRDLVGAARRLAAVALDDPVDRHLRHPPPGGELAAGDRDHPARGLIQLGLARDVDRLRCPRGDQRADPGVRAGQIGARQLGAEEGVGRVRAGSRCPRGLDVVELARVVVVGGADQPAPSHGRAKIERPRRPGRSRRRRAAASPGRRVMWVPRLGAIWAPRLRSAAPRAGSGRPTRRSR